MHLSPGMTGEIRIIFGENLKRLRKEAKMSLRALAATAEIEHADISRMEHGKLNASLDTIERLALALNVQYADFFKK